MMHLNTRSLAKRCVLVASVMVGWLIAPTAAHAQSTVYTTFGVGDSYLTGGAHQVSGRGYTAAFGFTYRGPSDLALSSLRFALFNYNEDWTFAASFWEGASMNDAVQREVWSGITGPSRIVTLESADRPLLVDGSRYWFTATATGDGPLDAGINLNSVGITDPVEFDRYPFEGTWQLEGGALSAAWEVNAAPLATVPEPGSLALLVAGCLTLLLISRRRLAV